MALVKHCCGGYAKPGGGRDWVRTAAAKTHERSRENIFLSTGVLTGTRQDPSRLRTIRLLSKSDRSCGPVDRSVVTGISELRLGIFTALPPPGRERRRNDRRQEPPGVRAGPEAAGALLLAAGVAAELAAVVHGRRTRAPRVRTRNHALGS